MSPHASLHEHPLYIPYTLHMTLQFTTLSMWLHVLESRRERHQYGPALGHPHVVMWTFSDAQVEMGHSEIQKSDWTIRNLTLPSSLSPGPLS